MRAAAIAWLLFTLMGPHAAYADPPSSEALRIAQQIERLGHPSYPQRRDAALELQRYGLRAFEQLWAARGSADAEVSAACERLLQAATRRWRRPSDSPVVRSLLREYEGRQDDESRGAVLQELRRIEATEALCRIARFELSERLSKEAAGLLLTDSQWRLSDERRDALADALVGLRTSFGASDRLAVSWLWLASHAGPAAEVSPTEAAEWWRQVAEAERLAGESGSIETSGAIQRQLVMWQLRAALRAGDNLLAIQALQRYAELTEDTPNTHRLATPLRWIAEADSAEIASRVFEDFAEELSDRRGLYLRARTLSELGDQRGAQEAVEAALGAGSPSTSIARWLRRADLEEWAEREAAAVGERLDPLSLEVIKARWLLFNWQLDAARYADAAETLAPVVEVLGAMPATGQWYADNSGELTPDSVAEMTARRWLAEGMALAEEGETEPAAEAFEKAYNRRSADGLADADVLIAMYRLEPASPAYRQQVIARIEELTEQLDQLILSQPDDAVWLNFWAWLVSNTVGDYDKAVRYSQRSLQLRPDEPGLLDTLARCYFARGDVDLAIDTQRRAVSLEPSAKVMQRQLEEFEQAQAEQAQADRRRAEEQP